MTHFIVHCNISCAPRWADDEKSGAGRVLLPLVGEGGPCVSKGRMRDAATGLERRVSRRLPREAPCEDAGARRDPETGLSQVSPVPREKGVARDFAHDFRPS